MTPQILLVDDYLVCNFLRASVVCLHIVANPRHKIQQQITWSNLIKVASVFSLSLSQMHNNVFKQPSKSQQDNILTGRKQRWDLQGAIVDSHDPPHLHLHHPSLPSLLPPLCFPAHQGHTLDLQLPMQQFTSELILPQWSCFSLSPCHPCHLCTCHLHAWKTSTHAHWENRAEGPTECLALGQRQS